MKTSNYDIVGVILYYIGIFFILKEWLIPIMMLSNTGYSGMFLLFIVLALLLNLFRVPAVISWCIKIFYIVWFIALVYFHEPVFSFHAWTLFMQQLSMSAMAVFNGQFGQVTDSMRTTLFLVLIWMLVYLVNYWVTVRFSIFYFFGMTVFFIAILDTFSPYDGTMAIVRVMMIGLVMLGLLYIKQIAPDRQFIKYIVYAVPLLVVIGIGSSAAIILPKSAPIWPDPVPFIKSLAGQGGANSTVSKVGYDEDDRQLGGGFENDNTVVFKAIAPSRQYWRVETKDIYTSKGWKQSPEQLSTIYGENTPIAMDMPIGNKEDESQITIKMAKLFPFVIQPYGMYSVATNLNLEGLSFKYDNGSGKIVSQTKEGHFELVAYDVKFREPTYSLKVLRETSLDGFDPYIQGLGQYLQLPESLPVRVGQLAVDITKNRKSVYDKVRAVEGYFSRAGFQYSAKNIAVPADGQDYVDQFLFDTKVGYCDNFSTSMVVMLRTLGIPARWVKGFAPGEQGKAVNGMYEYTVTNNDAHSWVEAYLPGVGWMPFEPTIGYSGINNIDFDMKVTDQEREQLQPEELQQLKQQEQKKQQQTTKKADNNRVSIRDTANNVWNWIKNQSTLFTWVGIVIVATGIWLFIIRRKWLPKIYVLAFRKKGINEQSMEAAYQILLKQLALCGIKRLPGQTLASFAEQVDLNFETDAMQKITTVYEMFIYSDRPENIDFKKLQESWEYLINRTSS